MMSRGGIAAVDLDITPTGIETIVMENTGTEMTIEEGTIDSDTGMTGTETVEDIEMMDEEVG